MILILDSAHVHPRAANVPATEQVARAVPATACETSGYRPGRILRCGAARMRDFWHQATQSMPAPAYAAGIFVALPAVSQLCTN